MSLLRKKSKIHQDAQQIFDTLDALNPQWINEYNTREEMRKFVALVGAQATIDLAFKETVIAKAVSLSESADRADKVKAVFLLWHFHAFKDKDKRINKTWDMLTKKHSHEIFKKV